VGNDAPTSRHTEGGESQGLLVKALIQLPRESTVVDLHLMAGIPRTETTSDGTKN